MKKYGKTALIVAAVAVVFLAAYFVISALWQPKEPQPAPDVTGVTADGSSLYSLSENKGKSGTVLIFFNLNTGNAVETMEQLSRLSAEFPTVDVMAVSTGEGAIPEQLSAMKEHGITAFPHTLFDVDGEMAKTYNVHGTPVTYFIDKNGLVQDCFISVISEKSMRKALALIA
jgi:peroxiredoxin